MGFGQGSRQQLVYLVTAADAPLQREHGRVAVYSVIKDDATSDEVLEAMSAVGAAAPLGGFRISEGQLIFQAEVPVHAEAEEIEQVVVFCGRIADACESLLVGDVDEF